MKNKKVLEMILLIFDAVVLIFAAVVIYRVSILSKLEKIGLEYIGKTNYTVEQELIKDGYIYKDFIKSDGSQKSLKNIRYIIENDNINTRIQYISNGEWYMLNESDIKKTYIKEETSDYSYNLGFGNIQLSFKQKLIIAVLGNIHADTYDFKNAYYIKFNEPVTGEKEILVDKETGLIVEQSENYEDQKVNSDTGRYYKVNYKEIQKFKFEFDTVKNGDIQKPDLTGYEQEQEQETK